MAKTRKCAFKVKEDRDSMVYSPSHYNDTGIEAIDAIRAALGDEGFRSYCRGNALKYLWRAEHKGNTRQDIEKAIWYLRAMIGDDPRLDELTSNTTTT
jgi:hypothetical protein